MSTKKSSKLKSTHMIDTRDNIVEDLPIYGHNFRGVKSPPFVNIHTLIFASKYNFHFRVNYFKERLKKFLIIKQ